MIRPMRAAIQGSRPRLHTPPAVVAPIASARTPERLADILPVASLGLTDDEVARLNAASA